MCSEAGPAGSVENDPDVWSGRAVQEVFVDPADAVLHQCSRPLFGAVVLRVIMDISAYAISLADRPRADQTGHQCSHTPGRPILHLDSSSRRPWRVEAVGYVINSSSCCAVPLFAPRTVPSSRPARGARITLDRTPSHRF